MKRTLEDFIGNTPLVRLQRLPGEENRRAGNVILAKLEGNNPAGSVKDRPAMSMIRGAEARGTIRKGDVLIEPTSGNTGIGLAMAAAIRGFRMILIMPEHLSVERRQTMRAFGAEIVLTPEKGGMEAARDLAEKMVREGKGIMLDQFANPDNPLAHYETTGPEIWRDTEGRITHFVSSMGTTGTIMGCSRFFKEKNPKIQIVGCQPEEGSQIPGIRKWPEAYLPKIYDKARVDRLEYVSQANAEEMTRRLAREEGLFAGISSGGAVAVALRISKELEERRARHHHLRSRRPLPLDRRLSRLSRGGAAGRRRAPQRREDPSPHCHVRRSAAELAPRNSRSGLRQSSPRSLRPRPGSARRHGAPRAAARRDLRALRDSRHYESTARSD